MQAFLHAKENLNDPWFWKNGLVGMQSVREVRHKILELLNDSIEILNNLKIRYALIKMKHTIDTITYDVDVLIKNPEHIKRFIKAMLSKGYKVYRGRFEFERFKVMLFKGIPKEYSIDIYPNIKWGTAYCYDAEYVLQRARILNLKSVGYAYIPSPEDELLIFSTHSLFSQKILLSELLHVLKLISQIEKLDICYIRYITNHYGLHIPISVYVLLLLELSKYISSCEGIRNILQRLLKWLIEYREVSYIFNELKRRSPISFPFSITVSESLKCNVYRFIRTLNPQYFANDNVRIIMETIARDLYEESKAI